MSSAWMFLAATAWDAERQSCPAIAWQTIKHLTPEISGARSASAGTNCYAADATR